MNVESKPYYYQIEGQAKDREIVDKVPEAIFEHRRTTDYDRLLEDAKSKAVKLTLRDEKRATSVYIAIRQKMKKDKIKDVNVGRLRSDVYVYPSKTAPKK